ncbi:DUF3291 domain-containing protein [Streptomyces griseoaurantiacus]|uniref:DUF3291 domain-containing protein n=1 Tax=Streptomyces griseoaurantiacus TaxID=68213 RepID=A0A1G7QLJ5_9ACTN|nr:DUF3291 domain-containing protein [Streptomyces jietaisiensis]SDF98500.1 protein of unknown function [Streptomyces jietaisiensis]
MPHLALYTFGVLKSPLADPGALTREFYETGDAVYRKIRGYPGYLGHAVAADGGRGNLFDANWGAWGEFAVPVWYGKGRTVETTALAATLSLWAGLRPAFDAVYSGPHRAALNRRRDWFERSGHPSHVFWWVSGGVIPTWRDGVSRLEHLHGRGPGPHAFTFRHPFAPDGAPARFEGIEPTSDQGSRA